MQGGHTPVVQVSSAAEENLKSFLSRQAHTPAERGLVTPEAHQGHAPRVDPATVAPIATATSTNPTLGKTPLQLPPPPPKSAPPQGQAAALYESQQHFVDVLRQLEARKAELRQQTRHQGDPAALAPLATQNGAAAIQVAANGAPAPTVKSKRSAVPTGTSTATHVSKRLRLVRLFGARDTSGSAAWSTP